MDITKTGLTGFTLTTGGVANKDRASAPEKNCRLLNKINQRRDELYCATEFSN